MRILGVDLERAPAAGSGEQHTLVLLDDEGRIGHSRTLTALPEVAGAVNELVAVDPFLVGVNLPVVVSGKPTRTRPLESQIRRRFGVRLPPGGRAALAEQRAGLLGETLIAGLATVGHPCVPYPDRDRRQSGLAEIYPRLVLKFLLWERSPLAAPDASHRAELFRAYAPPDYRARELGARASWTDQAVALDLVLRALGAADGFDFVTAREHLQRADSPETVERAAGLLDAALIAGTARRYLDSPETCLFLGDRESGYTILPADAFVRRLAVSEAHTKSGRLFPQTSLRDRLGSGAHLRTADLLDVPGRPQRIEARFDEPPGYEFDNLDEMLWWKHCRHLVGANLPTEGLHELTVRLGGAGEENGAEPLKLVRSRHRTLSFRFEPPTAWRRHVPTRDGKTYPFRVLRATYETAPVD